MFRLLVQRWRQGFRTMRYPAAPPPEMPLRFRGKPEVDSSRCPQGCRECAEACPTDAIRVADAAHPGAGRVSVDLGRCLFCTDCVEACPHGALAYSRDYRLAVSRREQLVLEEGAALPLAQAMDQHLVRLFGRSFRLRQVSAGGCNGCESDVNVLNTVGWDLSRFGIQFVASPRHADGLLITGPVTENMRLALRKTYDAMPAPKLVIAVGACAISGGPYVDHPEAHNGAASTVPVDLYIPGCPPHPLTILDGLLRLLGRLRDEGGPAAS